MEMHVKERWKLSITHMKYYIMSRKWNLPTFGNKGLPINNDVQGSSAYVANGMPTAAELLK